MNKVFDINRFNWLVARQLVMQYKSMVIGVSVFSLFVLLRILLVTIGFSSNFTSDKFHGFVLPFFFLGGYLITSRSFVELNNPHKGYLYLMLPATTLEKLLSVWLVGSLMYVIFAMTNLIAVNYVAMQISGFFDVGKVEWGNWFSSPMFKVYGVYFVTQPIFLLGAIVFRKVHLLKTLLVMLLVGIGLAIYTGLNTWILIGDGMHFEGDRFGNPFEFSGWEMLIKVLFWFCLPAFMLIVSYFKLKEREV